MKLKILSVLAGVALSIVGAALAFGGNVIVSWETQAQAIANAKAAHHYVVGLGVTEQQAALTARTITFSNVAPGSYKGWVVLVDANGAEMATPVTFSVDVPPDPTAEVPVKAGASIAP
jgi:hypothetical protein